MSRVQLNRNSGAARILSQWMDRAGPLLVRPGCKQMVNRLLSVLARDERLLNDEC